MQSPNRSQAVVIGGSMAGMLAARVLSRSFDRVVIIERDECADSAVARDGVPQARHLHVLLPGGHRGLEELFPGITNDWLAAGGELLDAGRDMAWRTPQGWGVRFESGLEVLAASRPLMDLAVQRRMARIPNISVMQGPTVLSLLKSPGDARVAGVRVRQRDGVETNIAAALTVDASGRMSQAPRWLTQLGFEAPGETVVDARLGYASRLYRRRPDQERQWRAAFIQSAPPTHPRGGIAFPVEDGRWIVTLVGGGGDYAPTTETAFLQFARSLPSGEVYNLIRDAEPLTPIVGYRRTENRWRHYERLEGQPEGFIVFGDAACSFNPVYAQGITTASMEAMELEAWLKSGRAATVRSFQQRLARVIATPWALAVGEDIRYAGSELRPGLRDQFLQNYVQRVMRVSTFDRRVRMRLLEVFGMVAGPERLLYPDVVVRVLAGAFRKRPAGQMDTPAVEERAAA